MYKEALVNLLADETKKTLSFFLYTLYSDIVHDIKIKTYTSWLQ